MYFYFVKCCWHAGFSSVASKGDGQWDSTRAGSSWFCREEWIWIEDGRRWRHWRKFVSRSRVRHFGTCVLKAQRPTALSGCVFDSTDRCAPPLCGCCDWPKRGDDQEDPEWRWREDTVQTRWAVVIWHRFGSYDSSVSGNDGHFGSYLSARAVWFLDRCNESKHVGFKVTENDLMFKKKKWNRKNVGYNNWINEVCLTQGKSVSHHGHVLKMCFRWRHRPRKNCPYYGSTGPMSARRFHHHRPAAEYPCQGGGRSWGKAPSESPCWTRAH